MSDFASPSCTAFTGTTLLTSGPLPDVALAVKAALDRDPTASVLTFDDATGRVIDFDLRGSPAEIAARLAPPEMPAPGRGRPKLGVVPREVTLLPRHWDWLGGQRGGASPALRRLVEEAMRIDSGQSRERQAREVAYRFMSAMAGDLPGFEEASRALFAGDRDRFAEHAAGWPADIRDHVVTIAWETKPEAEA